MKNLKKKGFTIVELVIVIAVIAVLAAVLIPTFVNLTRKANISSDTVLAKNLNTALAVYDAENDINDFEDVIKAIKEHGYLIANLNAKADGCYFVWEKETNQILLVDSKNEYKVLHSTKDGYGEPDESWYFAISDKEKSDKVKADFPNVNIKQTVANVEDLKDLIVNGETQTIYIDESFEVESDEQVVLDNGELTLKLSDATVSGNNNKTNSVDNIPFLVDGGKLTVEGGTISATGSWLDADNERVDSAYLAIDGELNLINTEVAAQGKSIVIAYAGANGLVSGTTITAYSSAINIGGGSKVIIENCTVNVDNEAVWVSNSGNSNGVVTEATIKGGVYNGVGNTIALYGGHIIIEDGEFTSDKANLFKFYAAGSKITIKGGTFSNANYKNYTLSMLSAEIIKGMFSTGSTNYSNIIVTQNADGSFTITN